MELIIKQKLFCKISTIKIDKIHYLTRRKMFYIPNQWKLILINDGSFTQNLNSLIGQNVSLNIINEYDFTLINQEKVRCVWLEDTINNKLTFAQSLLSSENRYPNKARQAKKNSIGKLLIEEKKDIHKELEEIYCGYSSYFNNHFKTQELIWARKCAIYYKECYVASINEIFSPKLMLF
uniref:Chorismate lyase n=1 Tax=Rhodymenia pseudopalmata TaxID=31502 RepID=A0A1C9C7L2_RHOPU|nr:hypothetical protein Rhodyp_090 [Rhodymenia pseudopalmata]AOM64368.1 hypothetical protein Rhodyp_090 [Rhodymenia pseudopalmata]